MHKRISLFNHKGGVSKTTTTFHLGWMLSELGYRVLLVDADPQCNLSGLILGFQGENEFEEYYANDKCNNIRSGLVPAFESRPAPIEAVNCISVPGCPKLYLLPGHIRLSEYEVTLGIAQELSGSIQTLQNLPGAITELLEKTAAKYNIDYILVDMNPSLSSINQNILMTSDFFLVPSSPDYFSLMAIESLTTVLPKWCSWSERAQKNPVLNSATYKYPEKKPQFLGTVIQKYRPRKKAPTIGFQKWIDEINTKVSEQFIPMLVKHGMLSTERSQQDGDLAQKGLCLAQISDFNNLITKSQEFRTPVFALTEEQIGHVGSVLETDLAKRKEFHNDFKRLARRVISLTK